MLNDPHAHGLWEQTAPRAPHTAELREDVTADVVVVGAGYTGQIGMTNDRLPRFHVFAPHVIGFSGYDGRGIAPATTFGRVLADFILGKLTQSDLPVPVSERRMPALRSGRKRSTTSARRRRTSRMRDSESPLIQVPTRCL